MGEKIPLLSWLHKYSVVNQKVEKLYVKSLEGEVVNSGDQIKDGNSNNLTAR